METTSTSSAPPDLEEEDLGGVKLRTTSSAASWVVARPRGGDAGVRGATWRPLLLDEGEAAAEAPPSAPRPAVEVAGTTSSTMSASLIPTLATLGLTSFGAPGKPLLPDWGERTMPSRTSPSLQLRPLLLPWASDSNSEGRGEEPDAEPTTTASTSSPRASEPHAGAADAESEAAPVPEPDLDTGEADAPCGERDDDGDLPVLGLLLRREDLDSDLEGEGEAELPRLREREEDLTDDMGRISVAEAPPRDSEGGGRGWTAAAAPLLLEPADLAEEPLEPLEPPPPRWWSSGSSSAAAERTAPAVGLMAAAGCGLASSKTPSSIAASGFCASLPCTGKAACKLASASAFAGMAENEEASSRSMADTSWSTAAGEGEPDLDLPPSESLSYIASAAVFRFGGRPPSCGMCPVSERSARTCC